MRRLLCAFLFALSSLALGCFSPVSPVTQAPDGSTPAACQSDEQCEALAGAPNPCAPSKAVCRDGVCASEPVAPIWQGNPGACASAADCACQDLPQANCPGGYECREGTCSWVCQGTGCSSDRDCAAGSVCEPGADCSTGFRCVPGCHHVEDCAAGEVCRVGECQTCPCPGVCETSPACSGDAGCPAGTVCERTPDQPQPHCIAGCRDGSGCATGESCVYEACPACANCPCVGHCQPNEECANDEQCPRGTVCGQDPECRRRCVSGCHADTDCAADERCLEQVCEACGCDVGRCVTTIETCSSNADCPEGSVCGEDQSCNRVCVPGCRSDEECGQGMRCTSFQCDACGCGNPTCRPVEQGCQSDYDCGEGLVCEPTGELCDGPLQCVRGCHGDGQCGNGESCLMPSCLSCPCPGVCAGVARCRSDSECGPDMVCVGCDPTGSDATCMPGCRDDSGCRSGETCAPIVCDSCPCPPGFCMPSTANCQADSDCPPGTVCEPGPGCNAPNECVPGCHDDMQCNRGQTCLMVPCTTCPCAGSCEGTGRCTDADGDGYVAECQGAVCPGAAGYCDCNDRDPSINPGASEICGNGQDDDCNGEVDESCACSNGSTCASTLDCQIGSAFCQNGCCGSCPQLPPPPLCVAGQCSHATGISMDGCPQSRTCGACCACPAVVDMVCGTNYATYNSPCEARCAGVEVLHRGACRQAEGLGCGWEGAAAPSCPPGTYCADLCPMCDAIVMRCTQVGACQNDFDCPAGLTPPACSAGPGRWSCSQHTCLFSCP